MKRTSTRIGLLALSILAGGPALANDPSHQGAPGPGESGGRPQPRPAE